MVVSILPHLQVLHKQKKVTKAALSDVIRSQLKPINNADSNGAGELAVTDNQPGVRLALPLMTSMVQEHHATSTQVDGEVCADHATANVLEVMSGGITLSTFIGLIELALHRLHDR